MQNSNHQNRDPLQVIAERAALIRSRRNWKIHTQHSPQELSCFLETVETTDPKILGGMLIKDINFVPEGYARDDFRDFMGLGIDAVMLAALPVVAYGPFITRLQPPYSLAVHQALEGLSLPKERVLFSAGTSDAKELLIYCSIQGSDYRQVVRDENWDAFYLLGQGNAEYARAGILTHDNSLDDWMFDGVRAIRIDLGAAEVHHKMEGNKVTFPNPEPTLPYRFFMTSFVRFLGEEKSGIPVRRFRKAMTPFIDGFFSEGDPVGGITRKNFEELYQQRKALL